MNALRSAVLYRIRELLRSLIHRWAFRGKARLVNAFESCLRELGCSDNTVNIRINGFSMELHLKEDAYRYMYYGLYEESDVRFMRSCLRSDSVFIDVGSADGYYVAQAAGIIGSRGSIHCFEPVPEFFAVLEKNVKNSNLQVPVFLNPMAVSDTIGKASMLVDSGKSRLIKTAMPGTGMDPRREGRQFIEVRTVTLDHYIREKKMARIDFIKMDIEGHELWALKGLEKHLESGGRPVILTEIGWALQIENDLFSYMESFGYKAFRFAKGRRIPVPHPDALVTNKLDGLGSGHNSLNVAWVCEKTDVRC